MSKNPGATRHLSNTLQIAPDQMAPRALRPANGALPARAPGAAKPQQHAPANTPANIATSRPANAAPPSTTVKPATLEQAEQYRLEAAEFDEIRNDPERERAYAAHRLTGQSKEQARLLCKFGLHFFRCSLPRRAELRTLLDQYGVSRSPLCWPRREVRLPCALDDCPVLGKGTFNKVFALSLDGEDYAFKPFKKVAERKKGEAQISHGGALLGLQEASFHPELRNMVAVQLADALGLLGPEGIVDEACIAIVNGVPGLLSRRVHGKPTAHGNWWHRKFDNQTTEAKLALWALDEDSKAIQACADPAENLHALGLVQAVRRPDHVRLTAARGKRSNKAAKRFESLAFNLDMARAQVFIWLANLTDHHPGNILHERRGKRDGIKLIDLDEGFAPLRPDQLKFGNPEDAWILADLALPILSLPASLKSTLMSEACQLRLARILDEAKGFLPEADLKSLAIRIKWLFNTELPAYDENDTWKVDQNLQPDLHLLDRVIGFSTHDFGESEDSESAEEASSAPVATEVG